MRKICCNDGYGRMEANRIVFIEFCHCGTDHADIMRTYIIVVQNGFCY